MNDGAFVINRDEYKSVGTSRKVLHVSGSKVAFFHCFGVAHIPKAMKRFSGNKNILKTVYRMQATIR